MNLMEETLKTLKARGNETAIINQRDEVISYKQLHDSITKISYLLRQNGVTPESKVVILAALDWPLYASIASLFQLGATVVLIDPWASSAYIEAALSQVSPEFLIISKKARLFYTKKAIRRIPKKLLLEDLLQHPSKIVYETAAQVDPEKTALITFTSGTTGKPKGFDRSHGFLLAQQEAHDEYFQHRAREIDLTMYPVFVLSNLKSGMTSVLIKGNLRKIDDIHAQDLYDQIIEHRVQSITLSPVILEKLINFCLGEKKPLPLKKVFTGGAPVRREICENLLKLNGDIQGYIVYGSTEAEPIALISMKESLTESQDLKLGTPLGRIVAALRWKLSPLEEKIHPYHHQGPVGDVHLTGKFVGKRYWNNEKAFQENKWVDPEGEIWHKTGDIALLKDDQLFMLGRRSFPIPTSEGLLFPIPIENQTDQIPGVKKSAYFTLDQRITLCFSGNPEAKPALERFFQQQLLPCDQILWIKEIPMDSRHRSKIDLPMLKTQLQGKNMLTPTSPLSSRLLAYTKERFPLIPVMLLVFLMVSAAARLLAHVTDHNFSWNSSHLWVSILTVFLFMLQLRMSDEIKDFDKDRIAYPERLLSSGIINLSHVRSVLYIVMALQFALNLFFGLPSLIMLVILQVYGYLMAKEFFVKEFIEEKIGLYLISHQLILVPMMIYSALPFTSIQDLTDFGSTWMALLFLCLPYTVYELSRKTWSADRENAHADSYTKFWGINKTLSIEFLLTLSVLLLSLPLELSVLNIMILLAIIVIYGLILFGFWGRPNRKMSKMVELGGSLLLLGLYGLNAFGI
jgi:olefin beta-lactone synthetase